MWPIKRKLKKCSKCQPEKVKCRWNATDKSVVVYLFDLTRWRLASFLPFSNAFAHFLTQQTFTTVEFNDLRCCPCHSSTSQGRKIQPKKKNIIRHAACCLRDIIMTEIILRFVCFCIMYSNLFIIDLLVYQIVSRWLSSVVVILSFVWKGRNHS